MTDPNQQASEAAERITGLICAKVNLGSQEYNKLFRADVFEILTQALQSRDSENARLNERVMELEKQLNDRTLLTAFDATQKLEAAEQERDRLSAELARVKKDSERLDWLETQDTIPTHAGYRVCIGHGRCLRQAIDLAIAEEKGDEK